MQAQDLIIGTTTTTTYDAPLAWIGMVLVHPDFRGRGVGYALMRECLDHLQSSGVTSIKLDATPLGKVLYERLDFETETTLTRWQRTSPTTERPFVGVATRRAKPSDLDAVVSFDAAAQGFRRQSLLKELFEQGDGALLAVNQADELLGYGMLRSGTRADYLGPVVASSYEAATALSTQLLANSTSSMVYCDVPDLNEPAARLVRRMGFEPLRTLTRMYIGSPGPRCALDSQFAIAGPATG